MGPGLRHRGRREGYESCSAYGNPRLANSPGTDTLSSRCLTTTFAAPAAPIRICAEDNCVACRSWGVAQAQ